MPNNFRDYGLLPASPLPSCPFPPLLSYPTSTPPNLSAYPRSGLPRARLPSHSRLFLFSPSLPSPPPQFPFLRHSSLNLRWFYLVVLGLGAPMRSPLDEALYKCM